MWSIFNLGMAGGEAEVAIQIMNPGQLGLANAHIWQLFCHIQFNCSLPIIDNYFVTFNSIQLRKIGRLLVFPLNARLSSRALMITTHSESSLSRYLCCMMITISKITKVCFLSQKFFSFITSLQLHFHFQELPVVTFANTERAHFWFHQRMFCPQYYCPIKKKTNIIGDSIGETNQIEQDTLL